MYCDCLGIVQCYWRGQQWLYQHSRDDRVSPRSLRGRRGRGGNQSDIFQNWCHRRQNHWLLGVWSLYHEQLYPNWHSDLQSVMNRIKNAGWKKVQRKRNKNGSISTRISDLRCQSILYLLLPHPNYKSCQWIFAKYNIWRRLLLGASHFRVSLYGRLFSGPSGSLPAFTEYCENFVKFYLQLYKLPGICRRVFDLCDKDSNGTLSFRVTSTCYVNYAITSQPHCLQLVL